MYLNMLYVSKLKFLFCLAGARDAIYRLTLDSLHKLEKVEWPATKHQIDSCTLKGMYAFLKNKTEVKSFFTKFYLRLQTFVTVSMYRLAIYIFELFA